jgi:2-phosphoxylose phosphatase
MVWFNRWAEQQDLWELYHDHLGFLRAVDPNEIWVRTSTEDRTMQVAGAMLAAMDPFVAGLPWPVYTQPASVRPRSRHPHSCHYH